MYTKSGLRWEAPWRCNGEASLPAELRRCGRTPGNACRYSEKLPVVVQNQFASDPAVQQAVGLAVLIRSAGSVAKDVVARELEAHFSRSQDGLGRPVQCVSYITAMNPPVPQPEYYSQSTSDRPLLRARGDWQDGKKITQKTTVLCHNF